jgi:uncharacterized membrane protein YfcA
LDIINFISEFYANNQEIIILGISLLAAGSFAGILSGLLGIGGGVVIVPALFFLFDFLGVDEAIRMHITVATSLSTIIATGTSSALSHHKKKSLDLNILKKLAPMVIIGSLLGSYIAKLVSAKFLTIMFAITCIIVAFRMFFKRRSLVVSQTLPPSPHKEFIGLIIGGVSSMLGIGGGSIIVPTLTAFGTPIHKAIGTSSAIGVTLAIFGSIGFMINGQGIENLPTGCVGYVNLLGFAFIAPASSFFAPQGAKIAHKLDQTKLRRIFAIFLILTAIKMTSKLF